MSRISLNNGCTWYDIEDLPDIETELNDLWEEIVQRMDYHMCEAIHRDMTPCTAMEFLAEYLRRAQDDMCI